MANLQDFDFDFDFQVVMTWLITVVCCNLCITAKALGCSFSYCIDPDEFWIYE